MLSSKSWIAGSQRRSGRRLRRRAPTQWPRRPAAARRRSSWRCRRCRRWRSMSTPVSVAQKPLALRQRLRDANRSRLTPFERRARAAPAGGARPAARPRRRSAGRARAAGRSCGGCCRRSSSRSAGRRASPCRPRPRRRRPRTPRRQKVGVIAETKRGRLAVRSRFALKGDAHGPDRLQRSLLMLQIS